MQEAGQGITASLQRNGRENQRLEIPPVSVLRQNLRLKFQVFWRIQNNEFSSYRFQFPRGKTGQHVVELGGIVGRAVTVAA